jgi:hypothetical protein
MDVAYIFSARTINQTIGAGLKRKACQVLET